MNIIKTKILPLINQRVFQHFHREQHQEFILNQNQSELIFNQYFQNLLDFKLILNKCKIIKLRGSVQKSFKNKEKEIIPSIVST